MQQSRIPYRRSLAFDYFEAFVCFGAVALAVDTIIQWFRGTL